jgi:hypothetical protein
MSAGASPAIIASKTQSGLVTPASVARDDARVSDVPLTSGPPETVLPFDPPDVLAKLEAAGNDRQAIAAVVAVNPALLAGWAALSAAARDPVEAYAYARVGYHRGLDALRAAGWRGSGYVRWRHPSNRGFLASLDALRAAAELIGENSEAERCAMFLRQLDPEWGSAGQGSTLT